MERAEIARRLMPHLPATAAGRPISETSMLVRDLGFDSLDSVELAMDIEEEFGISIPDTEWEDGADRTVGDVVELIATKLGMGGDHAAA